ncbi:MAG TPA: hypothetical protein VKU94_06150 [Geobacterales bacterium]|nr:hypothetical protein [Geobacterales bacterium]
MAKNRDDIIDVPFTEVPTEQPKNDSEILNLEDIAYMVVVGRTKKGETIFRTVGINDLILIRGLVEYARDEVMAEIAKHRK